MASRRRQIIEFIRDTINARAPSIGGRCVRGVGFQPDTTNCIEAFVRAGGEIFQYHTARHTHGTLDCSVILYSFASNPREVLDTAIEEIEQAIYSRVNELHTYGVTNMYIPNIKFMDGLDKDRGVAEMEFRLEYILTY